LVGGEERGGGNKDLKSLHNKGGGGVPCVRIRLEVVLGRKRKGYPHDKKNLGQGGGTRALD